jgi:hypothetical protein
MSAEPVEFGIGLVLGLVGVVETFVGVRALKKIAASLDSAVSVAHAMQPANEQKPSEPPEPG